MQGLTNGRIVHYVMTEQDLKSGCYAYGRADKQIHRPAIVVENWGNDQGDYPNPAVNLIVFIDGSNDGPFDAQTLWKTSSIYSEAKEPGSWHWPEKE